MPGRIRSIKPEFIDDEKLCGMSPVERLIFVCSWLLADDYGNLRGHPDWIWSQLFWHDRKTTVENVREALATLSRRGMLTPYEVRDQVYFHVSNWHLHQRVDKPGKPHCPAPQKDKEISSNSNIRDTLANYSGVSSETLAPDRDLDLDLDQEGEGDHPACACAPARVATPAPTPAKKNLGQIARERKVRVATSWSDVDVTELAERCRIDPTSASCLDWSQWPEVDRIHAAWCEAVGLPKHPLGTYAPGNRPLVTLLEAIAQWGVTNLTTACSAASRDDYVRGITPGRDGKARKRGTECMTPTVVKRLLDDRSTNEVDESVAAMLEEERARR